MNQKKGQAAMEFLMTYGWAILAAIIAIGVLAYIGVFSPSNYISNMVTVNAPFGTTQELSIGTTSIQFVLRNGGGDSATISNISVGSSCANNTAITMADGTSQLIVVPCNPALTAEDKFSENLVITYVTGEELVTLTSSGRVTGRVA
jgi:hypothetical protein